MSLGTGGDARMREALGIYEELGDLSSEAMVRCNLGCVAFLEGRWDEALDWFQGFHDAALRSGNAVNAATASTNIGEILIKRGRLDEALPMLKDVVRVMRASGFNDGATSAEVQLGRLLVARGQYQQAEDLLARVGAEFLQLGKAASALEAATVQAQARVGLGRADEALGLLDGAVAKAGLNARMFAAQVAEARALALASLGRPDEARQEVATGIAAARSFGLAYEEGMLLRTRAELDRSAGREPDAADVESAARILSGLGVPVTPRPQQSIS
jgi:tetratricopeptide (TPR) repeat protein